MYALLEAAKLFFVAILQRLYTYQTMTFFYYYTAVVGVVLASRATFGEINDDIAYTGTGEFVVQTADPIIPSYIEFESGDIGLPYIVGEAVVTNLAVYDTGVMYELQDVAETTFRDLQSIGSTTTTSGSCRFLLISRCYDGSSRILAGILSLLANLVDWAAIFRVGTNSPPRVSLPSRKVHLLLLQPHSLAFVGPARPHRKQSKLWLARTVL